MARPTEFAIRPAAAGDRVALLEFVRALNLYEAAIEVDRRTDDDFPEPTLDVRMAEIEAKDGLAFVAVDLAGTPIGWIAGHIEPGVIYIREELRRCGHISELYIVEGWRNRGVGLALIDAAGEHFRARGVKRLTIGSLAGNAVACAAYEALGFRPYAIEFERVISLD